MTMESKTLQALVTILVNRITELESTVKEQKVFIEKSDKYYHEEIQRRDTHLTYIVDKHNREITMLRTQSLNDDDRIHELRRRLKDAGLDYSLPN